MVLLFYDNLHRLRQYKSTFSLESLPDELIPENLYQIETDSSRVFSVISVVGLRIYYFSNF